VIEMLKISVVIFSVVFGSPVFAAALVEYRLEAKSGGHDFRWSSQVAGGAEAHTKKLEDKAFLSNTDLSNFKIRKLKSPPNEPDTYEVELVHTEQGRAKYDAIANKDRNRVYCVMIDNKIYQCLSFTPVGKELWDKSTSIHAPFSRQQAETLVASLRP